jgi:hypothetical protein
MAVADTAASSSVASDREPQARSGHIALQTRETGNVMKMEVGDPRRSVAAEPHLEPGESLAEAALTTPEEIFDLVFRQVHNSPAGAMTWKSLPRPRSIRCSIVFPRSRVVRACRRGRFASVTGLSASTIAGPALAAAVLTYGRRGAARGGDQRAGRGWSARDDGAARAAAGGPRSESRRSDAWLW